MKATKMLSLLLSLILMLSALPMNVWAEDISTDPYEAVPSEEPGIPDVPPTDASSFIYEIYDGKATITGYNGAGGFVVIPSEIDGCPVTCIGKNAFYRVPLKRTIIPDSVTTIESGAFSSSGLERIFIPDNVKTIGQSAFDGYVSIDIYCEAESEPQNWHYPWHSQHNTTVHWGTNTTASGYSYTISDGTATITNYCGNASEVVIPSVIDECPVISIGEKAFFGYTTIKSVTIPEGVTTVGDSAFAYCKQLSDVILPESLSSLGDSAFAYCEQLSDVILPESLSSLGEKAFSYCPALANLTVDANNEVFYSSGNCLIETKSRILIQGCYTSVLPSNLTGIGAFAFSGCTQLTSIVIPDGVSFIGNSAFQSCTSLESISVPKSATSLGNDVFWECTALTDVTLPDGITEIPECTFFSCSSLESVAIPTKVTHIGIGAFGCTSLKSITLPDHLTYIGHSAFGSCKSLTEITIPKSVSSIKELAFSGCTLLTDIYCEADTQPSGWDSYWNVNCNATVHFGVKSTLYGDVSGDGRINSTDVTRLLRYLANRDPVTGESSVEITAGADCNGDGKITSMDITRLLRFLANRDPITGESDVVLGK